MAPFEVMFVGEVVAVNGPAEGLPASITYDVFCRGVANPVNTLRDEGVSPWWRANMDPELEVAAAPVGSLVKAFITRDGEPPRYEIMEEPLSFDCAEGG